MPASRSKDGGKSWKYSASPFPGISWGQRLILRRLKEGPLLFVSFTDNIRSTGDKLYTSLKGMAMKTHAGDVKRCYGLFAALSFDEGETWPVRRFLDSSVETGPCETEGFGVKRNVLIDGTHGELKGYMAATQSPDGMIHVISSRLHYRFNMKWLSTTGLI